MEILNYVFWKTTRFRLKKDGFNHTYLKALLIFGLIFICLPLVIINPGFLKFTQLVQYSRPIQYLFTIPLVCLSALPFWLMFPKKIISNLNYSDEEKRRNNRKVLYCFFLILFLLALRVIYVKFYKY